MPWDVTMPPAASARRIRRLAGEVLRGYASLRAETDVMRCKIYSLLLSDLQVVGR